MVNDAHQTIEIHQEGGYRIALVNDYQLLDLEELKKADALVIQSHTPAMTDHLVKRCRTSREMVIYLIPIFAIGSLDALSVATKQVLDGAIATKSEIYRLTDEISRIKQNMQNLW